MCWSQQTGGLWISAQSGTKATGSKNLDFVWQFSLKLFTQPPQSPLVTQANPTWSTTSTIILVLILIHSRSRSPLGRRTKQFPKANTSIFSLASISHPQAVLQLVQEMYAILCQMTIPCVVVDWHLARSSYMAKAANLGLDEVEYDGITYKICMAELTTYCISASHFQEHGALVDHCTNGGIAGADCQVIETVDQIECYINIEGIRDHVIAKWCRPCLCGSHHTIEPRTNDCPHAPVCSSRGWNNHPLISTDGVEPSISWWLVPMCGRTTMTTHTWWIPNTTQHVPWSGIHGQPCTHSPTKTGTTSLMLHSCSRHHGIHRSVTLSSPMTPIGLSVPMTPHCSIQTLMHMEITITALLRVQHTCQMMRRPLQISKTIPHPHGHLLPRKLLIMLLNLVLHANLHQFVHAGSQTPLDSDSADDMFSSHHGPCKVAPVPHKTMTFYIPYLPGFLTTLLRKPLMSWLSSYAHLPQYAHLPHNTVLCKHFKSPNPALNVWCHNEDIATDTIFNIPTIDGGQNYAQIFVLTSYHSTHQHLSSQEHIHVSQLSLWSHHWPWCTYMPSQWQCQGENE